MPLNADETAGRFRVWLTMGSAPPVLVWDRKVEGGFPELKVLVSIPLVCGQLYMADNTYARNSGLGTTFNLKGPWVTQMSSPRLFPMQSPMEPCRDYNDMYQAPTHAINMCIMQYPITYI
jgi:hypothetical protein